MNKADAKAMRDDGIFPIKELDDGRAIAIYRFLYTIGLVLVSDHYADIAAAGSNGFERRFCYEKMNDAFAGGIAWDGTGDPAGPWVKEKSPGVDRLNPNLNDAMFDNE